LQKQVQDIFGEVNRTQKAEQQRQIANLRTDLQKQVQDSFEEVDRPQTEQQ
jgi:hypothetical protein